MKSKILPKAKNLVQVKKSDPVGVAALSIMYDPPVQDVELRPYVLLQCRNGTTKAVETEDDLKFGWFRSQKRVCAHQGCSKAAKLQCLTSLKLNLPTYKTFFVVLIIYKKIGPLFENRIKKI
eukprot:UN18013